MGPLQLDGGLSLLVPSICIAARPLEICPNQGVAELNKHAVAISKAPTLRLVMTSSSLQLMLFCCKARTIVMPSLGS